MYLIPSDQPEYGKYNLYNPYTEKRIYPALDTAYVVWDYILGYSNYDKEYQVYSNTDGHFARTSIQIYFVEFTEGGKEHHFLVRKYREDGKINYERCTQKFGWPCIWLEKHFKLFEALPKKGTSEPENHIIRLGEKEKEKVRHLYIDILEAGKI